MLATNDPADSAAGKSECAVRIALIASKQEMDLARMIENEQHQILLM
jgi:hypothetical protein